MHPPVWQGGYEGGLLNESVKELMNNNKKVFACHFCGCPQGSCLHFQGNLWSQAPLWIKTRLLAENAHSSMRRASLWKPFSLVLYFLERMYVPGLLLGTGGHFALRCLYLRIFLMAPWEGLQWIQLQDLRKLFHYSPRIRFSYAKNQTPVIHNEAFIFPETCWTFLVPLCSLTLIWPGGWHTDKGTGSER